jgi:glycerol-3-phosphate dehydrogenase (NAD(P)+)
VTRVGVLGAGSWGTTLAQLLAAKGHDVRLWAFEPEVAEAINTRHENPVYLPDAPLDERLAATTTIGDAIEGAELVVSAAPSHAVRAVLAPVRDGLSGRIVVSATKGLEAGTLARMSQVVYELAPTARFVVLSGPSFAREVYDGQPTLVVAASSDLDAAKTAQQTFATPRFRVYTGGDVIGVELAGALKNVIAIAAGILDGLGLGNNTRAALITRGLAEMARVGVAEGAEPMTFSGLGRSHPHRDRRPEPQPRARSRPRGGAELRDVPGDASQRGRRRQRLARRRCARETARRRDADRRARVRRALRGEAGPRYGGRADGTRAQGGELAMTARPGRQQQQQVQEFFSIGEVCALTDLKPHVLRYWESQFRFLNPAKNRSGNRVYKAREIELILLVKHLLYSEKYTIDGARQRVDQYRRTGELRAAAHHAADAELLRDLRQGLLDVLDVLNGTTPPERPAPDGAEP